MDLHLPALVNKKSAASGFTIERTSKRMKQAFQQMLKATGSGITVDQWVILQELNKTDGIGQNKIARRTFKDAPTVTRIIDKLCKKGLTRRASDPGDRRKFKIQLTEAGRSTIEKVSPTVQLFRHQAYQNLAENELDILMDILNRIFQNLEPSNIQDHKS